MKIEPVVSPALVDDAVDWSLVGSYKVDVEGIFRYAPACPQACRQLEDLVYPYSDYPWAENATFQITKYHHVERAPAGDGTKGPTSRLERLRRRVAERVSFRATYLQLMWLAWRSRRR